MAAADEVGPGLLLLGAVLAMLTRTNTGDCEKFVDVERMCCFAVVDYVRKRSGMRLCAMVDYELRERGAW
jgi:hypothetical protein